MYTLHFREAQKLLALHDTMRFTYMETLEALHNASQIEGKTVSYFIGVNSKL